MNVAELDISLNIDMSGFIEAMEGLLALIETMIQQMDELETRIEHIAQSGDKFGALLDAMKDAIELTEDLSEAEENPLAIGKAIIDGIKLYRDLQKALDAATDSTKTYNQAVQQSETSGTKGQVTSNTPGAVWQPNKEGNGWKFVIPDAKNGTDNSDQSGQLETS